MLLPPSNALTKEAQLLYGAPGSGKTTAWCHIRKWMEMTETPARFLVLSTEIESVLRCAEEFNSGEAGSNFFSNCEIAEVNDYDTLVEASKKYLEMATPNDWLVVDSISDPQEWSRDVFFKAHMDTTWGEFAQSGRKMLDVPAHGWKQMRETYNHWFQTYVMRFPGHRFATARSKKIDTTSPWANNESGKAKQAEYSHVGYFPVGNDQLAYPYHSVYYMGQTGPTERKLTTAKDRAREYQVDRVVKDFVTDVLIPVGGWRLD